MAKDKRTIPWSIKGVSPEAREAARDAVEASGKTMGEWLSEAIQATALAETAPRMPETLPAADLPAERPVEAAQIAEWQALVERIEAAERRNALMVAPLHEVLTTIARRLESLESRIDKQTEAPAQEAPEEDTPEPLEEDSPEDRQ